MDNYTLWSLRLGFSGRQAGMIKTMGASAFLAKSFAAKSGKTVPGFLVGEAHTPEELRNVKDKLKTEGEEANTLYNRNQIKLSFDMKAWWIGKMREADYPLREKMTVFWHNHFVASYKKVKYNFWVYDHNMLLRENAFGNFRELTKQVVRSNAMVQYLDSQQNRKGNYNENLSRELLELFTIGIGNYTEADIKNGARGLAGLSAGADGATYKPKQSDNDPFTYLGETGAFKADEMVDIIFRQPDAPYHITRKLLKWFIYDSPPEALVKYYGDYLRSQDYEIQPLLNKIFVEEFNKTTAGSKIKDPLVYILQLLDELNIKDPNKKLIALFLRGQDMDLFNQPNVKGWDGGNKWLTAQLLMQRNNTANQLCKGKNFDRKPLKNVFSLEDPYTEMFDVKIDWEPTGNNKDIIARLKNRLLFDADADLNKDFEAILKYDFDPKSEGADSGILRLFNYMVTIPEFQLI